MSAAAAASSLGSSAAVAAAAATGRRASAVVVGGTSGIGAAMAVRLASQAYEVTIVGRDATRGAAVVHEMQAATGATTPRDGSAPAVAHAFIPCDVSLLRNVRTCMEPWQRAHAALDVLVLTQGIATVQGRTETEEGLDKKLALHYYSRAAFIQQLLPQLRAAPAGRVMSVFSAGVHGAYDEYATDPELRTHYSLSNAANAAGMYNDVMVDAFSRQHENANVQFIHASPGAVATRWGTEMPWYLRAPIRVIQKFFFMSPEDCATNMCKPLLADVTVPTSGPQGGFKLLTHKVQPAAATRLHEAARDVVWNHTQEVLARLA